ncbi:hypothetical protein TUMEXPCC7403_25045 [Tumidithrix helvetica PCC 7403]
MSLFLLIVYIVYVVNPVPKEDSRSRKVVRNTFNLFIACLLLVSFWNFTNQPTKKQGIITEDISIYLHNDLLFKLPKGVMVIDETPNGINSIGLLGDRFMFSIIFSSTSEDFVDFSKTIKEPFYLRVRRK